MSLTEPLQTDQIDSFRHLLVQELLPTMETISPRQVPIYDLTVSGSIEAAISTSLTLEIIASGK